MPSPTAESRLIRAVASHYSIPLLHRARLLLGDIHLAEDVVQETMLALFVNLGDGRIDERITCRLVDGKLQTNSRLTTYLNKILSNQCNSTKKKRKECIGLEGQTIPSQDETPLAAIEKAEDKSRIQQALNRLSIEHRDVLLLRFDQFLKLEEIAEVFDLPLGTVKSRLDRAKTALRDEMSQFTPLISFNQ